jgi:hypothetical protein
MMRHCIWILAAAAWAGDWSAPVEVRHEEDIAIAYQARIDGPYLVVRAKIGPGWHTFCMDNKKRADEKLEGKAALSVDRPTEITTASGKLDSTWYQTSPKDFSHPELRWFSWGFEKEAVFAARLAGPPPSRVTIKGQACTESLCKNIDVTVPIPAASAGTPELNLKSLVAVQ